MNRVPQALIALLFVYVAVIALGTLCWPLGRDQGIFAWMGDVILQGGVPYRDAWDVKGLLTYYTYALSQLVFGRSMWGIRALDLIFLAGTAYAVAGFLRRYCAAWVAHVSVAFIALLHMLRGYWATAQPDGWGAMLVMIAGACVYLPELPSSRRRVIAGALIGLASLYKIVFLVFLLPIIVYSALKERGPIDLRLERQLPIVLGAGAVVLLSLAWLGAFGALGPFLQIQFDFNTSVHGRTFGWSPLMLYRRFSAYLAWYAWASPFIAVGFVVLWRQQRDLFWALVAQLFAAFAFVAIQNKYYSYHWHPVRYSLLLFFAFGISGVWQFVRDRFAGEGGRRKPLLRAALVAGLCAIAVVKGPAINREGISSRILGTTSAEDYYRQFKSIYNWSFRFLSNYEAVKYLLEHTNEDDAVLVWGFEPMINYLADRRSPTRFGYNYPLVVRVKQQRELGYRDEFIKKLAEDPPRYIVVGVGDQNSLMRRSSKDSIERFARFRALLKTHYEIESRLKGFEMWRRKPDAHSARARPGPRRKGRPERRRPR